VDVHCDKLPTFVSCTNAKTPLPRFAVDLLWTCRKGKLVILCFCCVFDLVDRDKSTANQKPNPIASIYCRLAWQYRVNVVSLVSNGR